MRFMTALTNKSALPIEAVLPELHSALETH
ncbi:MAG: hypothetical protein ACJAYK_000931, partial [Crocinitomicaceae bacterium]